MAVAIHGEKMTAPIARMCEAEVQFQSAAFACTDCVYGLSDMSGNVWEWTRSPYQPYPYEPGDDSTTAGLDALWVIRGGSFNDGEQMARGATRGGADPGARRAFIGFRVVLSAN